MAATPVLVIHGGAGVIRKDLTPEKEKLVRADLEAALAAGYAVLKNGGSSLDAVAEVDRRARGFAALQRGQGRRVHARWHATSSTPRSWTARRCAPARSPACIASRIPMLLARAVMEKSPHVMLIGDGAEAFAKTVGIELVDPSYFRTEERWQQLQEALKAERSQAGVRRKVAQCITAPSARSRSTRKAVSPPATSTGGMTNKRWGRVGDSPIIGAGTYANAHCAVSATGWGEYYIRATRRARHLRARRIRARRRSPKPRARSCMDVIPKLGGDGGVIALDAQRQLRDAVQHRRHVSRLGRSRRGARRDSAEGYGLSPLPLREREGRGAACRHSTSAPRASNRDFLIPTLCRERHREGYRAFAGMRRNSE